jgi:UDP-galactopyranose mutase
MYDYLIVGAGLFGSVFAHEATMSGKKCLVIEKRSHIGGNCYTEQMAGITVHKYGAHIFHTNNKLVWDFVNRFVEFNHYVNSPIANFRGELFNLPFNMNTFHTLWGVSTPQEAQQIIEEQKIKYGVGHPSNLEEQALSLVGIDIYEKLVKEYSEKQWGRPAKDLPAFLIRRLPLRFTYNNNYFDDNYQGIPIGGYTRLFEKLLEGIEVRLDTDFFQDRAVFEQLADKIVYSGMIDQYYNYQEGILEYRSLRFETEIHQTENFQGVAVMNFTSNDIPCIRRIEHKHFEFGLQPETVITREYPSEWTPGEEAYYPINDAKNDTAANRYLERAKIENRVIFGGRLAQFRYLDMHQVIALALQRWGNEQHHHT